MYKEESTTYLEINSKTGRHDLFLSIPKGWSYVYIIYDSLKDKRYIGSHNGKELNYFGSGLIIKNIYKKRKKDLTITPIFWHPNEQVVRYIEEYFLKLFDVKNNKDFYNLTDKAIGVHSLSLDLRQKISKRTLEKTKYFDCEFCHKRSNEGNYRLWHGERCLQNPNLSEEERVQLIESRSFKDRTAPKINYLTCEWCNIRTTKSDFTLRHGDKCRYHPDIYIKPIPNKNEFQCEFCHIIFKKEKTLLKHIGACRYKPKSVLSLT